MPKETAESPKTVATPAPAPSDAGAGPGADGRARMEDVAKAAGVALVTVSRAINTPDKLAPKTLAAIRQAIERLGYVPNLMAGSLASNRSRIIAAIVPTISNSLFVDTIDGLSETLAAEGYQLLIGQTRYRPAEESAVIDAFLGRRVDGIVLIGATHGSGVRERLKHAGIPIVETWDLPAEPIDMVAGFSNEDAGRAVASYLIDKGYFSLGYIGADEARSAKRMKGFVQEVERRGHGAVARELVTPPSSIQDGARMLAALIARQPGLRAVFCSNDSMAAGAMFECRRQGWAVPERIAIVGFSDIPIAAASSPSLTTVEVARKQMGARAGKMLLSKLAGAATGETVVDLGFRIIERESS